MVVKKADEYTEIFLNFFNHRDDSVFKIIPLSYMVLLVKKSVQLLNCDAFRDFNFASLFSRTI